jgi:purine-binding chemotaxis protein CheW
MQISLTNENELSIEEQEHILLTRAEELARRPEEEVTSSLIELTEFQLADQRFALLSTSVREVTSLRSLTPVPCTPPFVLGIFNLRGRILPLINIASFCGLHNHRPSTPITAVIAHTDTIEVGIAADVIISVRAVSQDTLQPAPATISPALSKYIRHITAEGTVVLDASRLLIGTRVGRKS